MLYFVTDYSEGAHEKVLRHLIDTNMEQLSGYGTDHYCETAKEKIKKACGCEDAEVYLLTGGTQTNQIVDVYKRQPQVQKLLEEKGSTPLKSGTTIAERCV